PLTARVMVNRIWQHHFSAGLVRTPSDFGARCDPPSHPELLDWLACRFIDEGWSIKQLHRLIMLSSVYQQSSETRVVLTRSSRETFPISASSARASVPLAMSNAPQSVDPENRLLWHFNRQRLDFETMRDGLLAASGELDLSLGGKAEELFKPPFSKRR